MVDRGRQQQATYHPAVVNGILVHTDMPESLFQRATIAAAVEHPSLGWESISATWVSPQFR